MNNASLAAKIKATNRANAYANELQRRLLLFFADYVGQKIIKADRSLTSKVSAALKAALGELPNIPRLQVRHKLDEYSLHWMVTAVESAVDGTGTHYADSNVHVGELKGDTLVNVGEQSVRPSDHTLEGVLEARRLAKEAKDAYDKAQGACWPFGE